MSRNAAKGKRAQLTRLRAGLVYWPEGQGFGAYRTCDRRSRRVGFVASPIVTQAVACGQLRETADGWIIAANAQESEQAGRVAPSAQALATAGARTVRQSALARLMEGMQAQDGVRARRWAQASVRWLADFEAISRSSVRTMDWSPVVRSGQSGGGSRAPVSYGRWRAGEAMRALTACLGLAAMNDLTRLFVGTSSVTALARDLGLSRAAVEARLTARLDALCEAYDTVLPAADVS